ncbi:protein PGR isoform X1 [Cucumis melo]|uniref:Protein PGR isoform X1 n=2 Tax=Cucumis melo TaxID=3656 RepID=A0ABM3KFT0_CUCME|nr:protein PGR isoform X1 [Cucumis melo]
MTIFSLHNLKNPSNVLNVSKFRGMHRGSFVGSWNLPSSKMEYNLIQPSVAVIIASIIAFRAYRRKSLNLSGALAGFIVMSTHFAINYRYGAVLLVFFFTSSKLTKVGEEKKRVVDADFKEGGQRNWVQVLFNSGIATVLAVIIWKITGWQDKCLDSKDSALVTALIGGILGHYSCCNGDTWSSELGILGDATPRLITNFKPVRKGTNGAVTNAGLLAATAAGAVIGLTFVLLGFFTAKCDYSTTLKQLLVIPLAAVAGLCGSVIDSLLGATVQFSGFCTVRNKVVGKPGPTVKRISGLNILDNNAVNLVSVLLTTMLTSLACIYIF